jgi:hypothetical protein
LLRPFCISGLVLFASLCLQPSLFAQVFEIGGGTSTLYQAGGGSITMHASSYDVTMGAGSIDGHILEGARLVKATPHATYILGDDRIDFRLPTDIFDSSHFLLARGAGISTTRGTTDILAFGGAIATDYNSPFFDGEKTNDPAGILFLTKKLTPHWQLFSDTIASKRETSISAIQWTPLPKLNLALAAGVGANKPYAAASLQFSRRWIDGEAAFIEAGQQFHRVALISPQMAEPDRGNVLVTVKPFAFLNFTGAHQNYLVPLYPSTTNVRSSVDQGSTGLRILGTQMNGTIYHSTYQDESNHAASLSATRNFTQRLQLTANYLASRPKGSAPTSSFISTFSEVLTSRLTVNQNVTTSGGHTGVTFGGQFLSNLVTIGANYETFYVPANNSSPFEQVLLLDVKMNLFGRLALHGASFVDPTGHLRNTVDARTVMSHGQSSGPQVEHVSIESAVMRGCAVDSKGTPVEGAALLIDQKMVYTDSNGCFFVREHRPTTHKLQIVLTEFLDGGNWYVVSAPSTITSSPEKDNVEIPIVVVLTHVRTVSSLLEPSVNTTSSR